MAFVFIILWFVTGAVVAIVMGRRGHHFGAWAGLAVLGPFAIPLALQSIRFEPLVEQPRSPRPADHTGVRLLIGVDGSPESHAAALQSVRLLGSRLTGVLLAVVIDYDTGLEITSVDRAQAEQNAARVAGELSSLTTLVEEPAVLVGKPAEALVEYAQEQGCDLIAIGSRGHGASRRLLGSVAERFAAKADIPVLLSTVDPAELGVAGDRPAQD